MKYLIVILFASIITASLAQKSRKEILSSNNIKTVEIRGFEYRDDSLINQSHNIEELDSFGNIIQFKVLDTNKVITQKIEYAFLEDGTTCYSEQTDKNGNIQFKFISIDDNENRTHRRMQFTPSGDTLVQQLWMYDINGNDSILFRIVNGKRFKTNTWKYSIDGIRLSEETYDIRGGLTSKNTYSYNNKKGSGWTIVKNDANEVIQKTYIYNNVETREILNNNVSYRSGLKLISKKGGKEVVTKLDNGLISKIEYFSKEGKLTALLNYNYLK